MFRTECKTDGMTTGEKHEDYYTVVIRKDRTSEEEDANKYNVQKAEEEIQWDQRGYSHHKLSGARHVKQLENKLKVLYRSAGRLVRSDTGLESRVSVWGKANQILLEVLRQTY